MIRRSGKTAYGVELLMDLRAAPRNLDRLAFRLHRPLCTSKPLLSHDGELDHGIRTSCCSRLPTASRYSLLVHEERVTKHVALLYMLVTQGYRTT